MANTTTPADKVENSGLTPQGVFNAAEFDNIINALNSKMDRLKVAVNVGFAANIQLDTALQPQPANAATPYKDIHRVTATGDITFTNPADGFVGQRIQLEIICGDGVAHTHLFGNKFRFSDTDFLPPVYSDTVNAVDKHVFEWTGTFWDCIRTSLNYHT